MSKRITPRIAIFSESMGSVISLAKELAEKYTVTLVHQGVDLIAELGESRYDLLLYIIATFTKEQTALLKNLMVHKPKLIIIVLNGEAEQKSIIKAFQIGICDYFPKPIEMGLVIERVEAILQQKYMESG